MNPLYNALFGTKQGQIPAPQMQMNKSATAGLERAYEPITGESCGRSQNCGIQRAG